ncbi:MAG TPA: 16S rRNA (cytosine(1402)-N(4))-methyltransferase RsmH, partial [Candidatus Eisenbacteria bacterium]
MSARHEPVLLGEVLAYLRNGPGLYLDATLGDGGHAAALLEAEPGARLLGCDRDPDALVSAGRLLRAFGPRVTLAHATFRELPEVLARAAGEPLAGALLDLGMSSRQIDDPGRGMSFQAAGPLDLRMDRTRGVPAAARLRTASADEIATALRELGDVPHARRVAGAIADAAARGRLETTADLVAAVERAGLARHPRRLAQVFQALRMWINDERGELDAVLAWLPGAVRPGGVVVTLAYHSGEDRNIKRALRGTTGQASPGRPRPPRGLPDIKGMRPPERPWDEMTHGVVTPTHAETVRNPRARSARLRAFRR